MSAKALLADLARAGFRVEVRGDKIRISPSAVPPALLEAVKEHKPELLAYLCRAANDTAMLSHYPVADGSYTPYVVPMSIERVAGLLADLRMTIGKVADIEGWTDGRRAHLLGLVARQPASTLADDLAYFRERLSAIEAVARAAEIGRQAVAAHDAIRKCSTCAHMTHHDHGVPVRCQMGKALGWRHHDWLDAPDTLNTCQQHRAGRGKGARSK